MIYIKSEKKIKIRKKQNLKTNLRKQKNLSKM